VLLAGPISLLLTGLLLIAGRGFFEHGPGVPSAGRVEAWGLIWVCLGLVGLGHAVSMPSTVIALVVRLRRHEELDRALVAAVLYHALIGVPLLYWLFT
jgi:hypothetical protein